MNNQKRKVEWSFDFESLGDRISQFVTDVVGDDIEVEYVEKFEPKQDARSAGIEIDFSVGAASLNALAPESDNLFEARIHTIGEIEYEASGGDHRRIVLRHKLPLPQALGRVIDKKTDLRWDIRLARDIPSQLRMKGGVGECDIDLSALLVNDIQLETGIGKVDLKLPANSTSFNARVQGGIGSTRVAIPAGSSGELAIEGGVGEVTIAVSADAPLRLSAKTGMGKLDLPENLIRQTGQGAFLGEKGVWETPGFAAAENPLIIHFEGGIGSFQLETFELL